jgi:hypothetical protein
MLTVAARAASLSQPRLAEANCIGDNSSSLSIADFDNSSLDSSPGVSVAGQNLIAPEPGTLIMVASLAPILFFRRRRHYAI